MPETQNFLATTDFGTLNKIPDCFIDLANPNESNDMVVEDRVYFYALPEISDTKQAMYSDQTIQGRSSPVKTYANSSNRTIGLVIHLYVTEIKDIADNLEIIRKIAALVHPEYEKTYLPPRIARIKCGKLLSDDEGGVPVVLKNYSVNYETNVQWFSGPDAHGNQTYMPLHVSVSTSWDVVYSWDSLPGHSDVLVGSY